MQLTIQIPDELAARLASAGANMQGLALSALRRAAEEIEHEVAGDERTGESIIAALQASPAREVELVVLRGPMPVRDISL